MAAALSHRGFAKLADVSPAAIGKAIRAGKLVTDETGKLDPEHKTNVAYLSLHRQGFNSDVRRMPARLPPEPQRGSGIPPPEAGDIDVDAWLDQMLRITVRHDDLDLDGWLEPTRIEKPEPAAKPLFTDWATVGLDRAGADRLLRRTLAEEGSILGSIVASIEALRAHVAAHLAWQREAIETLRRELTRLANEDISDDIVDRLDAIEDQLASRSPGEAA